MSMGESEGHCFAILPARGGSKRLPGKNIRPIDGIPAIGRTIQSLRDSKIFQKIVVSTDDSQIAQIAVKYGATVPFTRPAALSDDRSATRPVIEHALTRLLLDSEPHAAICCVYPTAFLLTPFDFAESQALFLRLKDPTLVMASVVRYSHPIERSLRVSQEGLLEPTFPTHLNERTQDLPISFHDAGQLYWARSGRWMEDRPLLQNAVPFELPTWRVQDLDTEDDWLRAEFLYRMTRDLVLRGSAVDV